MKTPSPAPPFSPSGDGEDSAEEDPMNDELTAEQVLVRDTVHEYLTRACTFEALDQIDQDAVFPDRVFRGLAEIGMVGLLIPEEHGGGDGSPPGAGLWF